MKYYERSVATSQMKRSVVSMKNFLFPQLRKLKEQEVSDLMKEGRIEELEQIAGNLNFFGLKESSMHLKLQIHDIREYVYEIAFYISKSKMNDIKFFEDDVRKEYITELKNKKEPLGNILAKTIAVRDLSSLSTKELLEGVKNK